MLPPIHWCTANGKGCIRLVTGTRGSLRPGWGGTEAARGSRREAGRGLRGPHKEAAPLTLDGRLAGLAHELVDGGQGLGLPLQGRWATGPSAVPSGLPHAPQEAPHSPLLAPLWALAAPETEEKKESGSAQRINVPGPCPGPGEGCMPGGGAPDSQKMGGRAWSWGAGSTESPAAGTGPAPHSHARSPSPVPRKPTKGP